MKQTHRYREQAISGYQWRVARGRVRAGMEDLEVQTNMYKIDKLQGYIAKQRGYSQYFITTINVTQHLQIVNHFVLSLKHKILYINYENEVKVLVAQSSSTLFDPKDSSPPGSSSDGILQVRITHWSG